MLPGLREDTAIRHVDRVGELYRVLGHSRGKFVSADIHVTQVEEKYGGRGEWALARAVEMVRDYEDNPEGA